jgi:hypothetical protein
MGENVEDKIKRKKRWREKHVERQDRIVRKSSK